MPLTRSTSNLSPTEADLNVSLTCTKRDSAARRGIESVIGTMTLTCTGESDWSMTCRLGRETSCSSKICSSISHVSDPSYLDSEICDPLSKMLPVCQTCHSTKYHNEPPSLPPSCLPPLPCSRSIFHFLDLQFHPPSLGFGPYLCAWLTQQQVGQPGEVLPYDRCSVDADDCIAHLRERGIQSW